MGHMCKIGEVVNTNKDLDDFYSKKTSSVFNNAEESNGIQGHYGIIRIVQSTNSSFYLIFVCKCY